MLLCLGNVEKTLVPDPVSRFESFMSSQDTNDRCVSYGLGSDLRGMLESGSVEGPSSLMAHQPSGDVGYISCSQEFLADLRGYHVLVYSDNTSVVSYINHQGGFRSRQLCKLACQILLWSQGKLLSLRAAYIPGAHNIGADILSRQGLRPGECRLHPEVVELIWRHERIGLHLERRLTVHSGSPSRIQLLSDWTRWCRRVRGFVCMHFPRSLCIALHRSGVLERVRRDRVLLLLIHCPAVTGQSMVPRFNIPSRRASSGALRQEGPSVPSRGLDISPPTRTVETVGLASEGAQLIDSGLSAEVAETILQSRAPSTRKLYTLKGKGFTSWCSDHQLDPVNCPVGTVL